MEIVKQIKNEQETVKKLNDQVDHYGSFLVEDAEISNKILNEQPLAHDDVKRCGEKIIGSYTPNIVHKFFVVKEIDEFDQILKNTDTQVAKPVVILFNEENERWVLICVVPTRNTENEFEDEFLDFGLEWQVLYKDVNGLSMSGKLQGVFKKGLNAKFIVHDLNDSENGNHYDLISLINMKILLDFITKEEDIVNQFLKVEFCTHKKIIKIQLQMMLNNFLEQLSGDNKFLSMCRKFIENIPLTLSHDFTKYIKILQEESVKDEDETSYERIDQARKDFLLKVEGSTFFKNYKSFEDKDEPFEIAIQREFPEKMKIFTRIFELLENFKLDDVFKEILNTISKKLKIDYKKMLHFYELKMKQTNEKDMEKTEEKIALKVKSMQEIIEDSPAVTEEAPREADIKSTQELLAELDIEDKLKKQFQCFFEDFEEQRENLNKENFELENIHQWAREKRTQKSVSSHTLCEVAGMMDRAYFKTTGRRLRDTQILSLLTFVFKESNEGKLCQIQTGEGKTATVALLATFKALQGHIVDVITSSPILAAEGAKEMQNFYNCFGLTVSTNNNDDNGVENSTKIGYMADVLYGTIGNYQFDYLRDQVEGCSIRCSRKFDVVVLDEVDSMLVDNGSHLAQIASPFPGMECLRYIYLKIWNMLMKIEEELNPDEIFKIIEAEINDAIKTTFRTLIPNHLKSFVKNQLHRWIRNAIRAKNDCQELKQYRLMRVNRENTVVPIDYLNTGISMKNMIWSDGLTQFIQLKHHLTLTFENLTSCFISNIGFIKKYDNANIFGLTGTLGSHAEQNLLSNIYRVSYATIPTYKEKRFEERDGYIAETDIVWLLMISSLAIENVDEGRAVLIICETEIDLNNIEYTLNQLTRFSEFNMRKYANENHVEETQKEVKPRDIILATNIAGRGTDFKTSNELEENGGLHVCVTFLPCNQRVEDQAFGRTSRQGKKGTSQLVIRAAEVERLGFNIKNPEFLEIKQKRDDHESNRLKEIENVLVKELDFKDELFERFVNYYKELKKTYKHEKDSYILHDFREYFAYWFQMKNYKGGELNDVTPESEFENFKEDAKEIIAGSIIHNPFNCIAAANYYLQNNVTDEAEKMLNRAIEMSENNLALTYGAYSKLAELKIDKAGQIWKRLRKGLGKFFFMDVKTDDNYKKEALKYMEKSKIALQKEIQVIEDLLGYKRNEDSDANEVHIKKIENKETKVEKEKVEEVEETAGNSVTDSEEINNDVVTKTINTYSYNINGRLAVLKSCYEHNELQIKKIKDLKEKDIICDRIVPISIRTFPIGDTFSVRQAVVEITSIGFNTFFILDEIHDIPKEKIHFAQAHLAGGVVAVVAGCAFPPSFFVMSGIGVSLIADAIIDVVFELLSSGKQEFDKKAFLKGKFILYAITLITAGVKIAAQMTKILTKAVQFCRVVSENLRESYPMLSKIFTKLAITIEKYEMLLQTKYVNSLNDNKFTQIWGTSKGVFEEKILPEVLNAGIQRGEEELEKFDNNFTSKSCSRECITFTLKECIHQNSELAKKICTNNLLTINEVVDEFLIENDVKKIRGCSELIKNAGKILHSTYAMGIEVKREMQNKNGKEGSENVTSQHNKSFAGDILMKGVSQINNSKKMQVVQSGGKVLEELIGMLVDKKSLRRNIENLCKHLSEHLKVGHQDHIILSTAIEHIAENILQKLKF